MDPVRSLARAQSASPKDLGGATSNGMDTIRNRWIFVGSLAGVFVVTLILSSPFGSGTSLLGAIGLSGQNVTKTSEMSPTEMVTKMVTPKKMVTKQNVTIINSVSPSATPIQTTVPLNTTPVVTTSSPSPTLEPMVTSSISSHPSTPVATNPVTPTPPSQTPIPNQPPVVASSTPPPVTVTSSTKININTADLVNLEGITGVGVKIGQAIIDYRIQNGPFRQIEDIINVKGIGPTSFLKMKDQITVGP